MVFPDHISAFSIHLDDFFLTENLKFLLKNLFETGCGGRGGLFTIQEKRETCNDLKMNPQCMCQSVCFSGLRD